MKDTTRQKERLSREERRTCIIDAATSIFADKGFSGTRTKDIANRAGISEALIFQIFKNKEELFRAVLEKVFHPHPVKHFIKKAIEKKNDYIVFKSAALHMIKHYRKDPRIVRLSIFGALEYPHITEITHRGEKSDDFGTEILAEYIQQRINDGLFKKVNAKIAALLFLDTIDIYIIDQELFKTGPFSSISDEEVIETLVKIFLNGLRK